MSTKAYSVSQINAYVKKLIGTDFLLQSVWVEGEISNLKKHPSGHIYMSLKDSGGSLRAVMFASWAAMCRLPLENGSKILAQGSLNVYERDGSYQLYIKQIRLAGTGDLQQAFELQKKKLAELGYFDFSRHKSIPRYAFRIGIVTAETGAALQDILNIARRRNPYVQLILCPALVQGDKAADSIAAAIAFLDRQNTDVIIVGRGGGSAEDLWAFNEEPVVRAIFEAKTPVISAVGHETDTTLADLAADFRAPTPSAAAELAVFDYQDYLEKTAELEMQLDETCRAALRKARLMLESRRNSLESQAPLRHIGMLRERLMRFEEQGSHLLEMRLTEAGFRLAETKKKLWDTVSQEVNETRSRLDLAAAELEKYSPLTRLSGAYAYINGSDGKGIRSVRQLKPGSRITVHFKDGEAKAGIEETRLYERNE